MLSSDCIELTIRIVDEQESAYLNQNYRAKSGPTNVLSFHYDNMHGDGTFCYLGDLVICAAKVIQEAQTQNKLVLAHWAHLIVQGILHLLGYDHETDLEADEIEAVEKDVLDNLNQRY